MDNYLKIIETNTFNTSTNAYTSQVFDSKGYKARFKVVAGSLSLYCGRRGRYVLEVGDTVDFVGEVRYYGNAEVSYILFDKV